MVESRSEAVRGLGTAVEDRPPQAGKQGKLPGDEGVRSALQPGCEGEFRRGEPMMEAIQWMNGQVDGIEDGGMSTGAISLVRIGQGGMKEGRGWTDVDRGAEDGNVCSSKPGSERGGG